MGRGVEALSAPPRLAPAFARSLLPRRRVGEAHLPTRSAVIANVTQERTRLAAYCRITGYTLRDRVPPTWLHVLTFPLHIHLLSDPTSSVRLIGAVHVSNRMTLRRPVDAGERVTLEVHAEALRPHARGALVDLVGQVRVDDEVVWDGVSTYLAQGVTAAGEAQAVKRHEFQPRIPHTLWRLPADLGRQYRHVSHDPNPIHTSRLAARAFGFQRPIIHGMWVHARVLATLEPRLPPTYTVDVAFTKPILLPATVGLISRPIDIGHWAAVTDATGNRAHATMTVVREPPDH